MAEDLPDYKGGLSTPSWSRVTITPEAIEALLEAALESCERCLGFGYVGERCPCLSAGCPSCLGTRVRDRKAEICPCTRRPAE